MGATTEPTTIVLFSSIGCAIVLVTVLVALQPIRTIKQQQQQQQHKASSSKQHSNNADIQTRNTIQKNEQVLVPFLTLYDPDWRALGKALVAYERELDTCLEGLSQSLEVCLQSEAALGQDAILSQIIRRKIETLSDLMELNTRVLRDLLDEFPTNKMIAELPFQELMRDTTGSTTKPNKNQQTNDPPPRKRLPQAPSSYDSINQIVAHLVRDWTEEGAFVRTSIYDWVHSKVSNGKPKNILIPGAGLGRLAWDLAAAGHVVEANEVSLTMACVARKIFTDGQESFTVHPFVTDFFANEVNSQLRYQPVRVQPPNHTFFNGQLSYTVGDFVQLYGSPQASYYDTVVTCFFLDTATNVLQYLAILSNLIPKGGQWINVGPLQWHINAQIHLSVDELFPLIEAFGFRIDHWSIDDKPVDYRLEDPTLVRFTKYEGYQPLRMVATKISDNAKRYPTLIQAETEPPPYSAAAQGSPPGRVTLEHLQSITTTIEELASDGE